MSPLLPRALFRHSFCCLILLPIHPPYLIVSDTGTVYLSIYRNLRLVYPARQRCRIGSSRTCSLNKLSAGLWRQSSTGVLAEPRQWRECRVWSRDGLTDWFPWSFRQTPAWRIDYLCAWVGLSHREATIRLPAWSSSLRHLEKRKKDHAGKRQGISEMANLSSRIRSWEKSADDGGSHEVSSGWSLTRVYCQPVTAARKPVRVCVGCVEGRYCQI